MANFVKGVTVQGELDLKAGTLTKITKDGGEQTYDLREIMGEFDGADVTISIRTKTTIQSVEEAKG